MDVARCQLVDGYRGRGPDPDNNPKMMTWAKDYWEALHPHSTGGVYLNFTMKEKEKRVKASLGKNYERLQKIKAKYDPGNMFRVNQNITPVNGQM